MIEAPDPLLSGDRLAHDWPLRSESTKHVEVPDVLLLVSLKISIVLRREGGWLHGQQFRSPATGMTGRNLQGLGCNLFYFHDCLCKLWVVNYHFK